jgi:uncharacterized LabA/DUF88 family protein
MIVHGIQLPSDPHLRRWMLFVDGENFTLRAQKLARDKSILLIEGTHYMKDVFAWLPGVQATQDTTPGHLRLQPHATRAYYYTAVQGDEDRLNDVKQKLWHLSFQPEVFKKKEGRTKGVDITLSKDLLINAFFNNYDVAVLIAGDGDYVPLVQEVKRLGKVIYLSFFQSEGLNPDLMLAADSYFEMEPLFTESWKKGIYSSR